MTRLHINRLIIVNLILSTCDEKCKLAKFCNKSNYHHLHQSGLVSTNMQINTSKTKAMSLGRLNPANFPRLSTPTGSVERLTSFKLQTFLGLHINTITAKASKLFYFLKQLKRAGVHIERLLHFYVAVIWPLLEYCTPVWHYAITSTQTEEIESIQKCAKRIIFPFTREIFTHTHRLLLILTFCIPDVTAFQSHSFKTFL